MKKVQRADEVVHFEQIPNVGRVVADGLRSLGMRTPDDLKRADPAALYRQLVELTGEHQDPCVLDTFVAVVDFMNGAPPHPWWHYSRVRLGASRDARLNLPRAGRSSRS